MKSVNSLVFTLVVCCTLAAVLMSSVGCGWRSSSADEPVDIGVVLTNAEKELSKDSGFPSFSAAASAALPTMDELKPLSFNMIPSHDENVVDASEFVNFIETKYSAKAAGYAKQEVVPRLNTVAAAAGVKDLNSLTSMLTRRQMAQMMQNIRDNK